jgi:hypothetical protein
MNLALKYAKYFLTLVTFEHSIALKITTKHIHKIVILLMQVRKGA